MIVRITAHQRELEGENLPFFTERGEVLRVAFVPVHIPVLQVPREGEQGPVLADALGIDEGGDRAKSRPGAVLEQAQAELFELTAGVSVGSTFRYWVASTRPEREDPGWPAFRPGDAGRRGS